MYVNAFILTSTRRNKNILLVKFFADHAINAFDTYFTIQNSVYYTILYYTQRSLMV